MDSTVDLDVDEVTHPVRGQVGLHGRKTVVSEPLREHVTRIAAHAPGSAAPHLDLHPTRNIAHETQAPLPSATGSALNTRPPATNHRSGICPAPIAQPTPEHRAERRHCPLAGNDQQRHRPGPIAGAQPGHCPSLCRPAPAAGSETVYAVLPIATGSSIKPSRLQEP